MDIKLYPFKILASGKLECRHRVLGCVNIISPVSAHQRSVYALEKIRIPVCHDADDGNRDNCK